MSGVINTGFLTFEGEPVAGRVPPRLIVHGPALSKSQQGAIAQLYARFCQGVSLSIIPYQVKETRLADGCRVRMESQRGVDRIAVWTQSLDGGPRYDIRPLALFVSLSAPLGMTSQGSAPWVLTSSSDVVSLWSNPPLTDSSELTFTHHARGVSRSSGAKQDLNQLLPGLLDWYDPRPESPHFGLVLSFWGGFAGRYSNAAYPAEEADEAPPVDAVVFSQPFLDAYRTLGPLVVGQYPNRVAAASYDRRRVWCNGLILAELGVGYSVVGVCLHRTEDDQSLLRVVAVTISTSGSSSAGQIAVFEGTVDLYVIQNALTHPLVALSLIATRSPPESNVGTSTTQLVLSHAAHCNASGTRAVLLFTVQDSGQYAPDGQYLYELNLDTGEYAPVTVPWVLEAGVVEYSAGTYTSQSERIVTSSTVVEGLFSVPLLCEDHIKTESKQIQIDASCVIYSVLAADYRGEQLEYLYQEQDVRWVDARSSRWVEYRVFDIGNVERFGDRVMILPHSVDMSSFVSGSLSFTGTYHLKHSVLGIVKSFSAGAAIEMSGSDTTHYQERWYPPDNIAYFSPRYEADKSGDLQSNWSMSWPGISTQEIDRLEVSGDLRVRAIECAASYVDGSYMQSTGSHSASDVTDLFHFEDRPHNPTQEGSITHSPFIYIRPVAINETDKLQYVIYLSITGETSEREHTAVRANYGSQISPEIDANERWPILKRAYLGFSTYIIPVWPALDQEIESEVDPDGNETHYYSIKLQPCPPPDNRPLILRDLGSTSSFDQRLYYRSVIEWPERGAAFDVKNQTPMDASLLEYRAQLVDPDTGAVLVDLNDPALNLNPCPGAGKTCSTLLFLGGVRDDQAGRFTNLPTYLRAEPS